MIASFSPFLIVRIYCGAPVSKKKDSDMLPDYIAVYEPYILAKAF